MSAPATFPQNLDSPAIVRPPAGTPRAGTPSLLLPGRQPGAIPSLLRRALVCQAGCSLLGLAVLSAAAAWGNAVTSGTGSIPLAAGLAISAPLVLLGAAVSWLVLKPIADLERQLHRLLLSDPVAAGDLRPASGVTPIEAGWNRLIRFVQSSTGAGSLDERLGAAVAEYRQRRGDDILNALTDGVAVTDGNQRITSANNALYSILHGNPAAGSLLSQSIEEALARLAGLDPAEPVLQSGHLRHRVVGELAFPNGDCQCTLRVCRTPLATGNGPGQGAFVWSVRDVTQQKLADKMRDQFVNAATHELRTPMANIKAYAETLALGEVDDVEQQKMFCNVINDEVTRLARFIDDLLHLSRMEAGATTLQMQITDMGRLLDETARKVRPQMLQKNIQFDVDLPARLPELVVDKDKLAVALVNLLGNAAKYTPEGGTVRMRVSLSKDCLQVDIEDTGIGIAPEELPRVFEKFYRSSDPRVHAETGTGLGLSLAHEIVRLHGGKLGVTSQVNKGSNFTISLPVTAE